ncbi:SRPBCC family protein [Gulosibacter molinativorax]|nr:SRPBCC family protein [Gulosibacter molinativorax]
MTIVAEFAAPVSRLWEAYADPRQLERFWGPVGWPATVTRHDMYPGGITNYYMSGPEGEISRGYWEFLKVDPGHSFEVLDGFALEDGAPNREAPSMRMVFEFSETAAGSRLDMTTHFSSLEELKSLVEQGMEEGTASAMSQMDAVITDLRSYAAEMPASIALVGDTQARVSRIIHGSVDQVWAAHHEPSRLKRWNLGPDGWALVVADMAEEVGSQYRFEWEPTTAEGERFGFEGELLEINAPYREVTTENMIGMAGPPARNELTLTPVADGTLLTLHITYPSAELREMVIGTGMVDGMEIGYQRLEREVLAA